MVSKEPLPTGARVSGMVGSWVHMGSLSQPDLCQQMLGKAN